MIKRVLVHMLLIWKIWVGMGHEGKAQKVSFKAAIYSLSSRFASFTTCHSLKLESVLFGAVFLNILGHAYNLFVIFKHKRGKKIIFSVIYFD